MSTYQFALRFNQPDRPRAEANSQRAAGGTVGGFFYDSFSLGIRQFDGEATLFTVYAAPVPVVFAPGIGGTALSTDITGD